MKKLFVAVLAIAALAACNKEEATILNTSKKSVSVTILNGGDATRAITDETADTQFECAKADELKFIFADAAGNMVEVRTITADVDQEGNTYTFHKLPENVSKLGVIAHGAATYASLAAAETAWKTEAVDANVADIIVYGSTTLTRAQDENGNDLFCTKDQTYPLFEGAVRVAPAHTRFEVLSFQCEDLGQNEYGYSEIELVKMKFAGAAYEQALGQTLTAATDVATPSGVNVTDETKVWSWNWVARTAENADAPVQLTDRGNLVVNLEVVGNNYTVPEPSKTLTITGYNDKDGNAITEFKPEYIYKLTVPFKEENIDATNSFICVDVEVTIAEWIINTMTPVFATNK